MYRYKQLLIMFEGSWTLEAIEIVMSEARQRNDNEREFLRAIFK